MPDSPALSPLHFVLLSLLLQPGRILRRLLLLLLLRRTLEPLASPMGDELQRWVHLQRWFDMIVRQVELATCFWRIFVLFVVILILSFRIFEHDIRDSFV